MSSQRSVIGVDVGGTKTSVAAMRGGVVGSPLVLASDRSGAQALIAQIVSHVPKPVTLHGLIELRVKIECISCFRGEAAPVPFVTHPPFNRVIIHNPCKLGARAPTGRQAARGSRHETCSRTAARTETQRRLTPGRQKGAVSKY